MNEEVKEILLKPASETFIRGITDPNAMSDGFPTNASFQFGPSAKNPQRTDGFLEESINWIDDANSEACLMAQKKETDPSRLQFAHGGIVFRTSAVENLMKNKAYSQFFNHERAPIPGKNHYHGNVLLKDGIPKGVKSTLIGALIVNGFVEHKPNPNNN